MAALELLLNVVVTEELVALDRLFAFIILH